MKAVGIVCEYNPFHRGHAHHLEISRERAGQDGAVVCVMSGDFVQRGDAAMYSKYARAEAACRCGADLVAELPLQWSLAPAESFARGAVALLAALGAQELCFGSECADAGLLKRSAETLLERSTADKIKYIMKQHPELSYASARERAVDSVAGQELSALLKKPNNILGIEYIKALHTLNLPMNISTVARIGSDHDELGEGIFRSASEIRGMITDGADISPFVPHEAMAIYKIEREQGRELSDKSYFETAVLSRLRMLPEEVFLDLPDAEEGLCRRIYKAVRSETSLAGIYDSAKTKRYSHARIRRLCISAALGLTRDDAGGTPPYARILAANERGRAWLRNISESCPLPLITKTADIRHYSQRAQQVFARGAMAHDIFVLSFGKNCPTACGEDWRMGPVIV